MTSGAAPSVEARRLANLRAWNIGVGFVLLVEVVLILLLSNDFAISVVGPVQMGPPGTELTVEKTFFDLRFSYAIAAFLLLATVDHLLMASPAVRRWYERNLLRSINYGRWIEYSISASLMIVLIAMLPGITTSVLDRPVLGERDHDPLRVGHTLGGVGGHAVLLRLQAVPLGVCVVPYLLPLGVSTVE